MTFDQFRDFIAANIDWFRGRLSETDSSLERVEEILGVTLPVSLKWLLKLHGYWHGTGVSNLADTVKDTLAARSHLGLPNNYVVLENFDDGGLILIDTGDSASNDDAPVYWIGMEDLGNPPHLEGNTKWNSFGDYVKSRLPSVQEFIEDAHIRYNPADFPEGHELSGDETA